ncbi:MAG: hypothetical protein QG656_2657 [Candidatus Hydrogenedentes bacterium]|nr:hypothetical protein [Candidatus Hydrogenedentota bacterium]
MYCPKCRAEYREGFTECADCGVPLVARRPPEPAPDYHEYETVLETGDSALLAVAQSLLDSVGIHYVVQGEIVKDLIGQGRLGTGFNPLTGPAAILVMPEDVEDALDILSELEPEDPEWPEDENE